MNTDHSARHSSVGDVQPTADDSYARESFTLRRMRPWQIWTLSIVIIGLAAAIFVF